MEALNIAAMVARTRGINIAYVNFNRKHVFIVFWLKQKASAGRPRGLIARREGAND